MYYQNREVMEKIRFAQYVIDDHVGRAILKEQADAK